MHFCEIHVGIRNYALLNIFNIQTLSVLNITFEK